MHQVDKQIGQRLQEARIKAGLTLRALATKIGMDHSTLSSYETGRRSLSIPRLIEIAQALGHSPASFLVATPEAAVVVDYIDGDAERCLQVGLFLEALDDDTPEPAESEGRTR